MRVLDIKPNIDWGDYQIIQSNCQFPGQKLREFGGECLHHLQNSFYQARDPNNSSRWYPLGSAALRQNRRGILNRRGTIEQGFQAEVTGSSLVLKNVSDVAVYHQKGTRHIPQRRVMFEQGLPPHLADRIEELFSLN